jgi:two-component system chemotaxis response regulator CheB
MMLSSLTTEGSDATLTALKLGAADFLAKNASQISLSVTDLQDELLHKLKALAADGRRRWSARPAPQPTTPPPAYRPGQFDVVCIGSSTGGPPVLETILPKLPRELRTPVVVAQHMPEVFTRSMAERLRQSCVLPVHHIDHGMPLQSGAIYIAPGGHHTHIRKVSLARWRLDVNDEPKGDLYKPSVDALVGSAAEACGSRALAAILTGIGEDGLKGCRRLGAAGGAVLAQSAETCVVYGMPKAVTQAGLANASLTPLEIAQSLRTCARAAVGAA